MSAADGASSAASVGDAGGPSTSEATEPAAEVEIVDEEGGGRVRKHDCCACDQACRSIFIPHPDRRGIHRDDGNDLRHRGVQATGGFSGGRVARPVFH